MAAPLPHRSSCLGLRPSSRTLLRILRMKILELLLSDSSGNESLVSYRSAEAPLSFSSPGAGPIAGSDVFFDPNWYCPYLPPISQSSASSSNTSCSATLAPRANRPKRTPPRASTKGMIPSSLSVMCGSDPPAQSPRGPRPSNRCGEPAIVCVCGERARTARGLFAPANPDHRNVLGMSY